MAYTLDFYDVRVYDDYNKYLNGTATEQAYLGAISWPLSTLNRDMPGIEEFLAVVERKYINEGTTQEQRDEAMRIGSIGVSINYTETPTLTDVTIDDIAPPIAYEEYENNDLVHLLEISGIKANKRCMVCKMQNGTDLILARMNTLSGTALWSSGILPGQVGGTRYLEAIWRGEQYTEPTSLGKLVMPNGSQASLPRNYYSPAANEPFSYRIAYDEETNFLYGFFYWGEPLVATVTREPVIACGIWQGGIEISGSPDPDPGGDDELECVKIPSDYSKYINIGTGTGLVTLMCPTQAQMQSFANAMWTDNIVEQWKKIFTNLNEAIINLSIVPVPHEQITTGETRTIKVGLVDSGISVDIAKEIVTIDYGPLMIDHKYNNFLDYAPYTIADIYLPYVGYKQLDINRWMGRSLGVYYIIDISTGTGVAYITRSNDEGENCVGASYECNVARQIPITGADYSNMIRTIMRAAIGVGTAANGYATMQRGDKSGSTAAAIGAQQVMSAATDALSTQMVHTFTSGGLSPNAGQINVQQPYVVINRPVSLSGNYDALGGKPDGDVAAVGDNQGYQQYYVWNNTVPCTSEERDMIDNYLRDGIYNNYAEVILHEYNTASNQDTTPLPG